MIPFSEMLGTWALSKTQINKTEQRMNKLIERKKICLQMQMLKLEQIEQKMNKKKK